MTTTSRVGMAGAQMKAFPSVMATVNSNGVPWVALLCTFAVGVVFFFPFPSWKTMAGYISSVTVLSYGIGPILLLRLRKALPNTHRPFKLRAPWLIAPLAFICSNWIILWVGAQTVNFILMLIVLFVVLHALHFFFVRKGTLAHYNLHSSWWLIPYFGGIWLISHFAPTELGGSNDLSFGGSMAAMAVFSLAILALALRVSQTDEQIKLSFAQALNAETPQASPLQL
jgi:amino acid transporter